MAAVDAALALGREDGASALVLHLVLALRAEDEKDVHHLGCVVLAFLGLCDGCLGEG